MADIATTSSNCSNKHKHEIRRRNAEEKRHSYSHRHFGIALTASSPYQHVCHLIKNNLKNLTRLLNEKKTSNLGFGFKLLSNEELENFAVYTAR